MSRSMAALGVGVLLLCVGCGSAERVQAPSLRVRDEAAGLTEFARVGWSLPFDVRVYFSNAQDGAELPPTRLDAEERAALAQLEAAQRAYALSPFDAFGLEVEVTDGAPRARFDDDTLTLEVQVPPAEGEPRVVSAEGLLDAWGADYAWEHRLRWYEGQPQDLVAEALARDCQKLVELDEALSHECRRLELLAGAVRARAAQSGRDVILTPSEVEFARAAQFRATYALYRVLNTLGRWRPAVDDEGFALQPAALALLVYARYLQEAYLGWVLETVVGGRSTVRIWTHGWWHRNPLYKVLDGEAQLVALRPGEEPGRLPAGSIRALLELRVDGDLKDWFGELDERWARTAHAGSADPAWGEALAAALDPVYAHLAAARELAQGRRWNGFRAWKELWDARLKNGFKFPFYSAIKSIAEFLGDTRTTHPAPAVDPTQLAALEGRLQPGDVLLVRQDHYLSNAFLPGFWPHAVLYLGPEDAWTGLRLPDGSTLGEDPLVARLLPAFRAIADGHPGRVLEAISEGVVFNSLEHAVQKDYVVAFRPRLDEAQRAEALRRALALHGRPYDFDFDFATDATIVCTEVVYRAYDAWLALRLAIDALEDDSPCAAIPGVLQVMGRETLPANELARYALYMREHQEPDPRLGYPGQLLELIGLYDREGDAPAEWLEGDAAWERLADTVAR